MRARSDTLVRVKIICAPDSFKESLTAAEAAEAMGRGVKKALPRAEVDLCPIADGGDGTVEALLSATNGTAMFTEVRGPLGDPVRARWGLLGTTGDGPLTAVIEMAAASGMALLAPRRRDPTRTSTFGTGQLIMAALDAGAKRIVLGVGGSATNDGGCGAAEALGTQFMDEQSAALDGPITGAMLDLIRRIDVSQVDVRLDQVQIVVACDVTNPLTGPNGAAHIYGPQKGATPAQVKELDAALAHLASVMRDQMGCDLQSMPGAGAAGGMGAGMVAFLGARLEPGVQMVLNAARFEQRVKGGDLCLTGEGRLDGQSLSGKACLGVATAAKRHGVETIALVGAIGPDANRTLEAGLRSYHSIGEGVAASESIRCGAQLLEACAGRVVAAWASAGPATT